MSIAMPIATDGAQPLDMRVEEGWFLKSRADVIHVQAGQPVPKGAMRVSVVTIGDDMEPLILEKYHRPQSRRNQAVSPQEVIIFSDMIMKKLRLDEDTGYLKPAEYIGHGEIMERVSLLKSFALRRLAEPG